MTDVGERRAAKAAPDQAQFSTGVVTQDRTAALALAANSRAMNAVFATLKRLGIADKDIQTSNFSLSPQYQIYKPGTSRSAAHRRLPGLEHCERHGRGFRKTGAVLDALVSSGSNQIDNIGFSIHDTKALLAQARAAAVKDAIDRAQTYAKAAGVTLGPIQSMSESGGVYQPRPMYGWKRWVAAPRRRPSPAARKASRPT